MKKKKKQSCGCAPQMESCKPVEMYKTTKKCEVSKPCETILDCEPISCCKPQYEKPIMHPSYVDCPCGDYEITCVDKCVDLAKKAEELFEKACKYEVEATQTFNQATECEKSAKALSQKACNLLQNANKNENQAKHDEWKAKELMQKAHQLCEKAKSLKKEAECIERDARENCEKAKCLYEKAENYNEKAKCLYNQALKYDEKALECYKTAGDKIKEYESKSKKCEEMLDKCGMKLQNCEGNCVSYKGNMDKKSSTSCGCYDEYCHDEMEVNQSCNCYEDMKVDKPCDSYSYDEIIYVDMNNDCMCDSSMTYVNPMYNMEPMQSMGLFTEKYPSLDDMNPYHGEYDEMWMNYYMYMQQMMQQTPPYYK